MNIEMCHECNEETGNGGVWDGSLIYEGNPYCENCYVPTIVKICEDSLYKITRLEDERDAMREEIAELRDGNEYVLVRELREQLRWRHWPEAPTKNGEYLFDHEEIPEKEVVSWIDGEWSVHNTYKTNHRWLPIAQDKGSDG